MNWADLATRLSSRLGVELGLRDASPVSGGNINQAWCLQANSQRFFVKTNRAELLPMFEAEQAGLDAIRMTRTIRVPEVFDTDVNAGQAYIVMEYIDLGTRADPEKLAAGLARMHACTQDQFGFAADNTIGSTPQSNSRHTNWVEFWQRERLGFLLELASQRGFESDILDAGHRLNERTGAFFDTYQPLPSLLHGDLWSGNWSGDAAGNPVLFDPACYYGDHEADLAMMELFGHPGERFFAAYHERFPIDAGYAERRDFYNLYHIFNHALLFGGSYLAQVRQMVERLLARI